MKEKLWMAVCSIENLFGFGSNTDNLKFEQNGYQCNQRLKHYPKSAE